MGQRTFLRVRLGTMDGLLDLLVLLTPAAIGIVALMLASWVSRHGKRWRPTCCFHVDMRRAGCDL